MTGKMIKGILRVEENRSWVEDDQGVKYLTDDLIWEGYIKHWCNRPVCARHLPQTDYKTRRPIVIMWPDEAPASEPFVELYYNERLVKYSASTFGHNAINVNGQIYNFSHLVNENEAMTPEEYFYRPALGEFAPSPRNGKFEILEDGTAYFDKFGRNFMRAIHVTRITGIDTEKLAAIYDNELEVIHNTPVDPKRPEKYPDFNFFTRSCSTMIRDGLRKYEFKEIGGFLPRDMYVSATAVLLKAAEHGEIAVELYQKPQLMVPEAEPSALTPLYNPLNRWRIRNFPRVGASN